MVVNMLGVIVVISENHVSYVISFFTPKQMCQTYILENVKG